MLCMTDRRFNPPPALPPPINGTSVFFFPFGGNKNSYKVMTKPQYLRGIALLFQFPHSMVLILKL
jgi:hypothetical protein